MEELKKYFYTSPAAPYIILFFAQGALTYEEALNAIKQYEAAYKNK